MVLIVTARFGVVLATALDTTEVLSVVRKNPYMSEENECQHFRNIMDIIVTMQLQRSLQITTAVFHDDCDLDCDLDCNLDKFFTKPRLTFARRKGSKMLLSRPR